MTIRTALLPSMVALACATFSCSQRDPSAGSPQPAAATTNASPAATPTPTSAPPALAAAHEAYLAGRFIDVGERIREVLLDPSSGALAKENALELLDKSYEATQGHMPSRFTTVGVNYVKLGVVMHTRAGAAPWHTALLYANLPEGDELDDFSLRRATGEPVLDFQRGIGDLTRTRDGASLEVRIDSPLPDGLYDIAMSTRRGLNAHGWIIARHLAPGITPEVSSPSSSGSVADGNPMIRWTPFRSPHYAPFEERTLNLWLRTEQGTTAVWDHWTDTPGDLASMRVCDTPAKGTTSRKCQSLEPGGYSLSVTSGEQRWFGPVILSRLGQTRVPFYVVK